MAASAKNKIELEIFVDCSCHTTYITRIYRSASDTKSLMNFVFENEMLLFGPDIEYPN